MSVEKEVSSASSAPPVPSAPLANKESFFWKYRFFLPDSLTVGNALCGLFAGFFGMLGNFKMASFLIVLGFILDAFDGPVARYLKCSGDLGMFLDSLADMSAFGIASSLTLLGYFKDKLYIGVPLAVFHAICTITRLAVFMTGDGFPGLFRGMPCPFAGVLNVCICAAEFPTPLIIILSVIFSIYMIMWNTTYVKPFSVKSKKMLAIVWLLHIIAFVGTLSFTKEGNILVFLIPFFYGTIPVIHRFYKWLFTHRRYPGKFDYALTIGVNDMFHFGHLELFNHLAAMAHHVYAGIHDDESVFKLKKVKVTDPLEVRMKNTGKQLHVKKVFPVNDTDPSECIRQMLNSVPSNKTACYMRGDDMINFPGKHVLEERKIPIIYHHYTEGISSSLLRMAKNKS